MPGPPAPLEIVRLGSHKGDAARGRGKQPLLGTVCRWDVPFRGGWRQMASLTACVTAEPETARNSWQRAHGTAERAGELRIYRAAWGMNH